MESNKRSNDEEASKKLITSTPKKVARLEKPFDRRNTKKQQQVQAVSERVHETKQEIERLKSELQKLLDSNLKKDIPITHSDDKLHHDSSAENIPPKIDHKPQSPNVKRKPNPIPVLTTISTKEPSPKKVKHYDQQTAREFIKKQKLQRKEKLKEQQQTVNTQDLKKQRLKELHQKTIQLVAENVKKSARKSLISRYDSPSKSQTRRSRSVSRELSSNPTIPSRNPTEVSLKPWRRSRSVSRELNLNSAPKNVRQVTEPQIKARLTERRSVNAQNSTKKAPETQKNSATAQKSVINSELNAQKVPQTEDNTESAQKVNTQNKILKSSENLARKIEQVINSERTRSDSRNVLKSSENSASAKVSDAQKHKSSENLARSIDKVLQSAQNDFKTSPKPAQKNSPRKSREPIVALENYYVVCERIRAATIIQAAYRGYKQRKKYQIARKVKKQLETSTFEPASKEKTPTWLQPAQTLPYPYNFISAVKKKLSIATRNLNESVNVGTQSSFRENLIKATSSPRPSSPRFEDLKNLIAQHPDPKFASKFFEQSFESIVPKLSEPKVNHFAQNVSESAFAQKVSQNFEPNFEKGSKLVVPQLNLSKISLSKKSDRSTQSRRTEVSEILSSRKSYDSDSDTTKNIPEISEESRTSLRPDTRNINFNRSRDEHNLTKNINFERSRSEKIKDLSPPDIRFETKSLKSNRSIDLSKYPSDIESILSHYSKNSRLAAQKSNSNVSNYSENFHSNHSITKSESREILTDSELKITANELKNALKRISRSNSELENKHFRENLTDSEIKTMRSRRNSAKKSSSISELELNDSKKLSSHERKTDSKNVVSEKGSELETIFESKKYSDINSSKAKSDRSVHRSKSNSEIETIFEQSKVVPVSSIITSGRSINSEKLLSQRSFSSMSESESDYEVAKKSSSSNSISSKRFKVEKVGKDDVEYQMSSKESIVEMKGTQSAQNIPGLVKPSATLRGRQILSNVSVSENVAQDKQNPHQIHLKFEAELHLLNSFNNSLQQVVAVEKSILGLENKENLTLRPVSPQEPKSPRKQSPPIEIPRPKLNVDKLNSRVNFKRGCDADEIGIHSLENTALNADSFNYSSLELEPLKNTTFESTVNQSIVSRMPGDSLVKKKNTGVVGISLDMFDKMIKDEDARIDHLKAILKIREKALFDRTKGELAWLEIQKKQLRDSGQINEISMVKKKQRGLIIKLQQERHEMQRLKKAHKSASKERKMALNEQKNLMKLQLSTADIPTRIKRTPRSDKRSSGPFKVYSITEHHKQETLSRKSSGVEEVISITSSSVVSRVSDDDRGVHIDKVKRSLLLREEALQKRRREAEELLQWHKRLKEEEMKIAELEQAANSIPQSIPDTPKIITGAQLNRFWRNITGSAMKKFDDRKKFSMSQKELEQFFLDARKIFREVSDDHSIDSKASKRKGSFTDYVSDFEIASSIKTLDNVLDSVSSSFVNQNTDSSVSEKSNKTILSDVSYRLGAKSISEGSENRAKSSDKDISIRKDSIISQYSSKNLQKSKSEAMLSSRQTSNRSEIRSEPPEIQKSKSEAILSSIAHSKELLSDRVSPERVHRLSEIRKSDEIPTSVAQTSDIASENRIKSTDSLHSDAVLNSIPSKDVSKDQKKSSEVPTLVISENKMSSVSESLIPTDSHISESQKSDIISSEIQVPSELSEKYSKSIQSSIKESLAENQKNSDSNILSRLVPSEKYSNSVKSIVSEPENQTKSDSISSDRVASNSILSRLLPSEVSEKYSKSIKSESRQSDKSDTILSELLKTSNVLQIPSENHSRTLSDLNKTISENLMKIIKSEIGKITEPKSEVKESISDASEQFNNTSSMVSDIKESIREVSENSRAGLSDIQESIRESESDGKSEVVSVEKVSETIPDTVDSKEGSKSIVSEIRDSESEPIISDQKISEEKSDPRSEMVSKSEADLPSSKISDKLSDVKSSEENISKTIESEIRQSESKVSEKSSKILSQNSISDEKSSENITSKSVKLNIDSPFSDIKESIRETSEKLQISTKNASKILSDMKTSISDTFVSEKLSSLVNSGARSSDSIRESVKDSSEKFHTYKTSESPLQSDRKSEEKSSEKIPSELKSLISDIKELSAKLDSKTPRSESSEKVSDAVKTQNGSEILSDKIVKVSDGSEIASQTLKSNLKSEETIKSDVPSDPSKIIPKIVSEKSESQKSEPKPSTETLSNQKTSDEFETYASETKTNKDRSTSDGLISSDVRHKTVKSLESQLSTLESKLASKNSELDQSFEPNKFEMSCQISENIMKLLSQESRSESEKLEKIESHKLSENQKSEVRESEENETQVSLSLGDDSQNVSKENEENTQNSNSSAQSESESSKKESEKYDFSVKNIAIKISEPISLEISVNINNKDSSEDLSEETNKSEDMSDVSDKSSEDRPSSKSENEIKPVENQMDTTFDVVNEETSSKKEEIFPKKEENASSTDDSFEDKISEIMSSLKTSVKKVQSAKELIERSTQKEEAKQLEKTEINLSTTESKQPEDLSTRRSTDEETPRKSQRSDDSYNSEFEIDIESNGAKSDRSITSAKFDELALNLKGLSSDSSSSLSSNIEESLDTVRGSPDSKSSSQREELIGVSHIDVRKRVSEIMADTTPTAVSRGDKSPRLQDFYVTTYDVMSPSPGSSPEIGSPTSDFDPKGKDILVKTIYGNEAEELRRKQLEIEQEIKRLEQQQKENVPYCFMREIPNKPPPPYKPPVSITPTVTTVIPTDPRQVKTYIGKASTLLYNDYEQGKLSEKSNANIGGKMNSYRFVFDLCKEIALDIQDKSKVDDSGPTWMQVKPRLKPLEINKKITKEGLESVMSRKVQQLLGLLTVNRKDNLIVRWSRKKRDHVDEILVLEGQTEEADWTNYDRDELTVKDNLTNEILDALVAETAQVMSKILAKKRVL